MTTDADLTEQIAREMYYSEKPEERHRNGWNADHPDERWRFRDLATAVLPILRRAQAEAWDEGQASGWDEAQDQWATEGMVGDRWKWADAPNPYREETP